MLIFFTILLKIAPLYLNLLLGYLAGKFLNTPRDVIARIMFFIINPIIMFNGIINTKIDSSILSLPCLTFVLSSSLCLLFYRFSNKMWDDSTKNLLAFTAGSGNMGYFGLPIALMLFDNQGEGVYMMALLGISIYENTIGFYIFAKGTHTPRECLSQLYRLPTMHAFLLALLFNYLQIPLPALFAEFTGHIKGTYSVLGMMIIGLSFSTLSQFKVDMKFIGMSFLAKFVAWPLLILSFVFVDTTWLGFYGPAIHQALILLSIVPIAVNSVILATILKTNPEKAAAAVLISTIFALFYVPIMILYFMADGSEILNPSIVADSP